MQLTTRYIKVSRVAPLALLGIPSAVLRLLATLCLVGTPAIADVLPDDRADVLYHNYDGGGITIQGPSVLVRKKVGDSLSFTGSYYEDLISSASIDVKLSASPYHETRKQEGASVDFLHGKTIYTAGYIHSREPDYSANTMYFAVSQNMFGDLTTVSFGYRRGWDDVFRDIKNPQGIIQNDPTFHETADHRGYTLAISQILTRNAILDFNFEALTDQGYLQSPYREILYVNPTNASTYSTGPQVYPNTRTSTASSAQFKYYLPYRAAVTGEYRFYTDTWGIVGNTVAIDYTHPFKGALLPGFLNGHLTLDGSVRFYKQNHANFYSDEFLYANYSNFEARDRELAAFHSLSLGFGAEYEFPKVHFVPWLNKSSISLHFNHLMINYSDFRNELYTKYDGTPFADDPLYKLNANIVQLFISAWF